MDEHAAAGEEEEEVTSARKRKRDSDVELEEEVELECDGGLEKVRLLLLKEEEEEDGCFKDITEEAVAEVMRWLEAEITNNVAAGFVTININEESCGSSFSCAASTVMASIDTRAGAPPPPSVPWPGGEDERRLVAPGG